MRACECRTSRAMELRALRVEETMDRVDQMLEDYAWPDATLPFQRRLYRVVANGLEHLGIVTRLLVRRPELRAEVEALRAISRDMLSLDELEAEAVDDEDVDMEESAGNEEP